MCRLFKIRPPGRKGWKLHGRYSSRKALIKEMRRLKDERIQAQSIKKGGIGTKFPYEIYSKTR